MGHLWIANSITDLIEGDVREHIPLERIPLAGDVLGMGTTTSYDNGELAFLHDRAGGSSRVYKAQPEAGGVEELIPGEGLHHFPYVCFSADSSGLGQALTAEDFQALAVQPGEALQAVIGRAIVALKADQRLPEAPVYGLRLVSRWSSLVYTVASKLCLGERRRNQAITVADGGVSQGDGRSIYAALKHFRVGDAGLQSATAGEAAGMAAIRDLGSSPAWDGCGFWDTQPQLGRLTVPVEGEHLHLHGCSLDLRHGGHLHHEHAGSSLVGLDSLVIYPFNTITHLGSDLAVEALAWKPGVGGANGEGTLVFRIHNRGQLDVSDVGVAVVLDDLYSSHCYGRLPWLTAGESEDFALPFCLAPGAHRFDVVADPHADILEPAADQANNRASLSLVIG
jgi:hypothetical protein